MAALQYKDQTSNGDKNEFADIELTSTANPLVGQAAATIGEDEGAASGDEETVDLFPPGAATSSSRPKVSNGGKVQEDTGGRWQKLYVKAWRYWELKMFDPTAPRAVQLFRRENIAIVLCYALVGLFQGVTSGVLNVYPLQLGATEAQQTTVSVLRSVPATLKIAFGFLSDTVPLFGYRRKVYMGLGWLVASLGMLSLAVTDTPSIAFLSFMTLTYAFGFWFADVMADALVAEKAKLEPPSQQGVLQSTCYAYRFFFLMVGVLMATVLYDSVGPRALFGFLAVAPWVCMALPWWHFHEDRNTPVAPVREQCRKLWDTVSNRSVFQPMGFVYIFNALQIGNAAWKQYLYTVLKFSAAELNWILVVSECLLFAGVVCYKQYMRTWSWRLVYVLCIVLNAIFSTLQLMLIQGTNRSMGIPDLAFALGDEAMMEFVLGVQFLPLTIMMVHLCPEGSEGVSYAMFTTMNNVALILASIFSTNLLGIWDVSEAALSQGDLSGLTKLTLLTTALQASGALFLPMLPRTKAELHALGHKRSYLGGCVFLGVVGISLAWSLTNSFLNILAPGWSGES